MESFEEEDQVVGKIVRDNFSDELPDSDINNVFELVPRLTPGSQPIDDSSVPSWIGEVETLLMKDDEDDKESGGEVLDADDGPEKGHGVEGKNKDGEEEDPDDPDSKKRRRIPAVGFPALVPEHRVPVHQACNALGGSSSGNRGKESSRNRCLKRSRK